ncbi:MULTISPECIES: CDP-diacylglycerol--serine O-phosphatidyltransferase [unclassified Streptomyces]|uniref:CDP-diacylglycerol--serine O-phosphatidyltransferase n=1 Tax=unclassified Streptomyces TaxID=2593676 RepID=UPI0038693E34
MSVTDSELPASWTTEEIAESAESAQNAVSPARLSIADVLTLGNAVCGFASVYFITTNVLVPYLSDGPGQGVGEVRQAGATAVLLMLMASLFDLCDGLVARRFRSSGMGAELDNLSDLISFGLAPAYFVVVWGLVSGTDYPGLVVLAGLAVLLAGLLRLARFSCTTMQDGMFQGMPIPFAALTVVSIVLLQLPFVPTLLAVLGVAWLMVSRVEYPKPTGKLAVATIVWGSANIGCLVAWATGIAGGEKLMVAGCTLQVLVAAVLPVFAGMRRINAVRQRRAA